MKTLFSITISRMIFCTLALTGAAGIQAQDVDSKPAFIEEPSAKTWHVNLQQINATQPKFRLQFSNNTAGKVSIHIIDAQRNNLYNTTVGSNQFVQVFDLSTLQDGAYTFVLSRGKEVITKTVYLNTDVTVVKRAFIR